MVEVGGQGWGLYTVKGHPDSIGYPRWSWYLGTYKRPVSFRDTGHYAVPESIIQASQ